MSDELYDNQHLSIEDLTDEDSYDATPEEPVLEFAEKDLEHFIDLFQDVIEENGLDWDAWLTEDNARKQREAAEADLTVTMEDDNAPNEDRPAQEVHE